MDRQEIAKDNAEHLFKYAINQNDNIKKYFIINKDSNDYYKMKKLVRLLNMVLSSINYYFISW